MNQRSFTPERKQFSTVILGNFNPGMFQPEWFCRQNIISKEDADFARDTNSPSPLIVTPQFTTFRTSQLAIQIEENRFEVKAEKEPLLTMIDFIMKTFENLGSYQITAFGFNYIAHYKVDTMEIFHRIGDKLAPKTYWESLLEDEIRGVQRKSGLSLLQMKKMKKDSEDYILFTLQPSPIFHPGFMLGCNDHNVIPVNDQSAEYVTEIISTKYINSYDEMEKLQISLLEKVNH